MAKQLLRTSTTAESTVEIGCKVARWWSEYTSAFGEISVGLLLHLESSYTQPTGVRSDSGAAHLVANRCRTARPQSYLHLSPAHRRSRLVDPFHHPHLLHLLPLALHDLIPPAHPQSQTSLSLLQGYFSVLARLQSRCTEYTALAARMVQLARLSRAGDDVQGAVMQVSETVGRAEEGWRRVQVGYVEWVNGVTVSSQGLARAAIEGGEQEARVLQALQSLHVSKVALHESLKAVFRFLNLLSSRGVAIATSLHSRRGFASEHYFKEGEENEVERVWVQLRGEIERARETLERLRRAVGSAGVQVRPGGDP